MKWFVTSSPLFIFYAIPFVCGFFFPFVTWRKEWGNVESAFREQRKSGIRRISVEHVAAYLYHDSISGTHLCNHQSFLGLLLMYWESVLWCGKDCIWKIFGAGLVLCVYFWCFKKQIWSYFTCICVPGSSWLSMNCQRPILKWNTYKDKNDYVLFTSVLNIVLGGSTIVA